MLLLPPTRQNMAPGWSPGPSDPDPYFQVDFLQPTFLTAVVTQGGGPSRGYVSRYRLVYSNDGVNFRDYARSGYGPSTSLRAQVPPLPMPFVLPGTGSS